jgi:transposase-like protein
MRAKTVGGIEQAARVNGRKPQSSRRDAAQWARIIEAQRQSDLTVVEFCRRRGIAKATFWYWRKRLVRTAKQEQVAKPAQRFLAVPLVAPVAERIEVDLGTMRVRLDGAGAARVVDAIVARVGSGAQR